jgi:menaquinone-specific isochorismate synthase
LPVVSIAEHLAPVVVRTAEADPQGPLLAHLPEDGSPVAWVREDEGLVGWGVAATVEVSGPDRFERAAAWWRDVCAGLDVRDELGVPGSGPVAFGSFAFADRPGSSRLVLPRVVIGRRDGRAWVTTVGQSRPPATTPRPPRGPDGVRYSTGSQPVTAWREAVAAAVARIRAGELAKVVLAYDLLAQAEVPVDPRHLLARLAERYSSSWTFAVDGLVGATPELLVRRVGDTVLSRVLAGTLPRHGDVPAAELAATLSASAKDRSEHAYAVDSAVDSLRLHCADLVATEEPYVLGLANVLHLASDISGRLVDGASALALAAALHPTAAVGGTPTDEAVRLIAELEPMDRGRYAGPVGWVDARGDGEWGIALRCAEVAGPTVRMFAGCGIVADSDPDAEVVEAQAKFLPVRDALES